jgi:anti-sigma regulatory factor (Ser/Thr protein kinase)
MAVELADIAVAPGEHVLQFYEDGLQLARTVGRYLSDAVRAGAVAIVIATEAHRRAFEAELEAAGIDPAKGCLDGTLILLDAAATMAAFMDEGQVNNDAFRRVIGSLVRQAGETGKPVRAYGEMVALLWEAGNVVAAIELEKSWNELSRELPFGLLCGYHSESVLGDELSEALQQVCHLHSSVLRAPTRENPDAPYPTGAEVSAQFAAERTAPRSARHFVVDTLGRWGYAGSVLDDAQLLVTELATNAVVHARSPFSVVARREGYAVRVSVRDACPVRPKLRDVGPPGTSGNGLRLVAALAADWGVELTADGKTVWAELRPS